MTRDKRLIRELAAHETDIDLNSLERYASDEEVFSRVRDTPMARKKVEKARLMSIRKQEKFTRNLYNVSSKPSLVNKLFIMVSLGKEGIISYKHLFDERVEFHGNVYNEATQIINGSPLTRNEFEEAFARGIDEFGLDRFERTERGYSGIFTQAFVKLNEMTSRKRDNNPTRSEKYDAIISANNAMRVLGTLWMRGYIEDIKEIHSKYFQQAEEASSWQ